MRAANFVEETTTSIAGTNGDGAVTLTGISQRPRFSQALGTARRQVRYVIHQISTGKMETGIGYVAANVLTRSKVQTTFDGASTYLTGANGAVALAFGSAPTSNDVLVRLSPTAESFVGAMPGRQVIAVGDNGAQNMTVYPISSAMSCYGSGGSGSTIAANAEYYSYYKLESSGSLQGIAVPKLAAGGTGMKVALYELGADGLPAAKIVDFNPVDTTVSGYKFDTVTSSWTPAGPVWLNAGWYAFGFVSDGSPGMAGTSGANTHLTPSPVGRKNGYGYSSTVYVTGKSYANGLPVVPDLTGAIMADPGANNLATIWFGMKVVA